MAKKDISAAKPADHTVYKALVDLILVCAGVFFLQFVGRNYAMPGKYDAWRNTFMWLSIAAFAIAVIGAAVAFAKKPILRRVGLAAAIASGLLAAAFWSLYAFWFVALPYLYFFLIAGCSLYLVYLMYPLDFFLIASLTTLSGGVFYLHGQSSSTGKTDIVLYALLILLAAATVIVAHKASANKGIITLGKKVLRLYAGKANATPLYLTCAIMVACIIAALVLGCTFAFYCVYAAVGGLFIAACYYTIRLN